MRGSIAAIAAATLMILAVPTAQAQLGVAAGLNFESVSDLRSQSLESTYGNATGYHAGVFLDVGAGAVALRLGAFYRELGEFDVTVQNVRSTVDVSALDFPVDLRFQVLPTPVVSPYILGGPVFSIPRSTDEDYDESLESISVSGNVGFGLEVSAGGLTLLPEFRYAIGVSPFIKDQFTVGGRTFVAEKNDQRSNSVMLRLGLKF
ncbi:MAG: PorT family protein [Rhodothermales bacterium]|nr:PorT family protein [Rhodothermales bacterium]MBO6780386.1 PorT family protein [Rhodothermales bacterium]